MLDYWKRTLVSGFCVSLLLLLSGCERDSTSSNLNGSSETDFTIYTIGLIGSEAVVSAFDFGGDLLDSAGLPGYGTYNIYDPSRKRVFANYMNGSPTTVIDLPALAVDTTIRPALFYHFDPVRDIGLAVERTGLYRFDPGSLQYSDSIPGLVLYFSEIDTTNGLLYGSGLNGDSGATLYQIDYKTMQVTNNWMPLAAGNEKYSIWEMLPLPDMGMVVFSGLSGSEPVLAFFDLAGESVTATAPGPAPAFGYPLYRAADNHLYVPLPDYDYRGAPDINRSTIGEYDLTTKTFVGELSTKFAAGADSTVVTISALSFSPDGRYMLGAGADNGFLPVYDLEQDSRHVVQLDYARAYTGSVYVVEK